MHGQFKSPPKLIFSSESRFSFVKTESKLSKKLSKSFYYINTNEIPGELSRENMISSHVKITCYLHM